MQRFATAKPPHRLRNELGVIIFPRIASQINDETPIRAIAVSYTPMTRTSPALFTPVARKEKAASTCLINCALPDQLQPIERIDPVQ